MADDKKKAKVKRPTALKRDIQNKKRQLNNRSFKSKVHTAVRSYEKQIKEKDLEAAKTQLPVLYSLLDKCVKKNLFKLNKVKRLKSKYSAQITG